jgi:hypothetical protein
MHALALKTSSQYIKILPLVFSLPFDCLQEVMAEHNPQYLIELDGNKSPEELFMVSVACGTDVSCG